MHRTPCDIRLGLRVALADATGILLGLDDADEVREQLVGSGAQLRSLRAGKSMLPVHEPIVRRIAESEVDVGPAHASETFTARL